MCTNDNYVFVEKLSQSSFYWIKLTVSNLLSEIINNENLLLIKYWTIGIRLRMQMWGNTNFNKFSSHFVIAQVLFWKMWDTLYLLVTTLLTLRTYLQDFWMSAICWLFLICYVTYEFSQVAWYNHGIWLHVYYW